MERTKNNQWQIAVLVVLLLAGLAYWPSLSGTFFWDDVPLVNGSAIGGGDSLAHCLTRQFLQSYYRPLVSAVFFLENRIADLSAIHYHLTNIFIHVLATLWLIRLLLFAFHNKRAALFGGLFFGLQPVQVGGVAWIGGRTDALCGLFMIAFADGLLRGSRAIGRQRVGWIAFSAFAYLLALLTKEQMLGAIFLVPLAFRLFPPENAANRRADWKLGLPFVGAAVLLISLMAKFGPSLAQAPVSHGNILLAASRTLTYYSLLLLFPAPKWMHTLSVSAFVPLGWLVVPVGLGIVAAIVGLFIFWKKFSPASAWFLAWAVCIGLPVSNLMPLPSLLVAPYRMAVAGIGIAALLGKWIAEFSERNPQNVRFTFDTSRLPLAIGLWYFALTWWGAGQWHDTQTFFGAVERYDPGCLSARYNLAGDDLKNQKAKEALAEVEGQITCLFGSNGGQNREAVLWAVQNDPKLMSDVEDTQGGKTPIRERLAKLYALLVAARRQNGDIAGAKSACEIGLALNRESPEVNRETGETYQQSGESRRAIGYLKIAAVANPKDESAVAALAQCLLTSERWHEAEDAYTACIRLDPDNGGVYALSLARAQSRCGETAQARATLQTVCATPMRPLALRELARLKQE